MRERSKLALPWMERRRKCSITMDRVHVAARVEMAGRLDDIFLPHRLLIKNEKLHLK